jgi:hypothetical protein
MMYSQRDSNATATTTVAGFSTSNHQALEVSPQSLNRSSSTAPQQDDPTNIERPNKQLDDEANYKYQKHNKG